MTTIRLTMAQALLKFLDNQYIEIDGEERKFVKGVMGIFGHGNVTGIGEALENDKGTLQFIQGKNEQGMAHAAMAFAKQKNRLEIFACTSSIGPGALNMVTAAGTATVNRIPVLFLPGDIFACRQPDPVLQQVENPADYTISANDAFKPVSKYWDRISRPEQLMTAALQAMRVLTDPVDTGAVTLSLPQDVQCEAFDYPADFFDKRIHYIDRRSLSAGALQRAVDAVKNKKKPIMIVGGGVHYSLAVKEMIAFAEEFQIPVVETQAGKSALPWTHPLNMGGIGTTGSLAANKLAREADLVICAGTRMADFPTASKSAFQNPDVSFININVSAFDAMKMNSLMLVADAKEAFTALQQALRGVDYKSSHDINRLAALKEEWDAEVDRLYAVEREDGLAQTKVLGTINSFIGKNDVIVCAAGSLPGDLHRLWRCENPNTYHMEYGFSCMGYEVSGAFGAKLADPGREVYAVVGDGSFLMLHSELLTSIQEGRKITVILLDNHGFQCIHNLQRGHGSSGFGNEFRFRSGETNRLSGDFLPLDFTLIAKGLGVKAYTAGTIQELQAALANAKDDARSVLIEVKVVPGTNTDGYESWWRVGVAEVSESTKVTESYQAGLKKIETVKKY
ncbi:3D-(3,5/4)-trihydroxycyclohexane-1,2-dione acylhydrolase (decyclizing) [Paenibacillus sp. sptzw28]|uniref:3D-(3,5/4)-trihydroxycyclohexane-1,2-dione acylhydrolase (decyclizing) n=1 Tax=Paenibacillus sp. sptzw28 TaxID=715179 RepID=UPI001C6E5D55|nr:3D-(3,5/4)-trihydroxycyclohexane-1,2-dione acylhydrolase (decyclizing) [Paenibacillus sp. sptzw28]QYR23160.1 3D-(3,5/4)-trihydroxycyclohexane-1,2-dione acylhydrolase (decyclizing) [Paenibacillus sp. sptzw28]